jgi:hypothetical protein
MPTAIVAVPMWMQALPSRLARPAPDAMKPATQGRDDERLAAGLLLPGFQPAERREHGG